MTAKVSIKKEGKIWLNMKTDSENNLLPMGSNPTCEFKKKYVFSHFRGLTGSLCVLE